MMVSYTLSGHECGEQSHIIRQPASLIVLAMLNENLQGENDEL